MAETLGKKAAKKASGKKRGRPRKETVQAKRGPGRPRKETVQAKRGPGRPRKDAGERMNVIDAQDALDTIGTSPSASRTLTKREKNAFERNFGEGTAVSYTHLTLPTICSV